MPTGAKVGVSLNDALRNCPVWRSPYHLIMGRKPNLGQVNGLAPSRPDSKGGVCLGSTLFL